MFQSVVLWGTDMHQQEVLYWAPVGSAAWDWCAPAGIICATWQAACVLTHVSCVVQGHLWRVCVGCVLLQRCAGLPYALATATQWLPPQVAATLPCHGEVDLISMFCVGAGRTGYCLQSAAAGRRCAANVLPQKCYAWVAAELLYMYLAFS